MPGDQVDLTGTRVSVCSDARRGRIAYAERAQLQITVDKTVDVAIEDDMRDLSSQHSGSNGTTKIPV